jgi:hypothetical protein
MKESRKTKIRAEKDVNLLDLYLLEKSILRGETKTTLNLRRELSRR